jgi:hypothetical protein
VSSEESVNVADPKLPGLTGFELINSWTGVESRSSFANGTLTSFNRDNSINVVGPESWHIHSWAASVVVDGKSYSTRPIQIKVLEGRAAPPQAQQPPDAFEDMDDIFNQLLRRRLGPGGPTQPTNPDEAFFIQVEVDKEKAFAGEQITASWFLYTRGQIHDIDTLNIQV